MAEDKLKADETVSVNESNYEAPAIEEIVSREGLEREVAYAGISLPSGVN